MVRQLRHNFAALSIICALALISPVLLTAQETARWDVFGGFSAMRFDSPTIGFADYSYMYGWNAEVTGNIFRRLGVTLDGSGNYGSQMTLYHYMIGPQFTWRRRDTYRFFVRGLFGKEENMLSIPVPPKTSLESVGRSFGGGGGFDWDFNKRITIRVVQADYLNTHTFGQTQNNYRVSAGVVLHFGHMGHRPRL